MSHLGAVALAALPMDLDPSADQARQWLSDELARSEYQDTRSLFQRLIDWITERLADLQSTQGTGGASFPPIVITVVVVLLLAAIAFLLTRIRVESKVVTERTTLLGDGLLTADQLRREAERALADSRFGDAVLAWTRAIARDAESRTLLPDAPSMTAHEVGTALAAAFPAQRTEIGRTIDLFDAVAYGGARASREDALTARSTDAALRATKPVLPPRAARRFGDGDAMPPSSPEPLDSASKGGPESVWLTGVRR